MSEILHILAQDGLLELLPHRSAAIPTVDADKVLELYAVRVAPWTSSVEMEVAVRYMVAQLPRHHYDPQMWTPSPAGRRTGADPLSHSPSG